MSAHREGNDGQHGANHERYAPAPDLQLIRCEEYLLQQKQDQDCANLSADQRYVLEARVKPTMILIRDFSEIRGAGAILPTEAQSLNDARNAEEHRRRDSDRAVCR